MKKGLFSKKITWWIIGSILVIGSVAAILLTQAAARNAEAETPAIQTAKVRTGNLVISAAGSGSVEAAAQAQLGFRTGGVVAAVHVSTGQEVRQGEVLASLDNTSQHLAFMQADSNLQSLFSPSGIAAYQLEVVNAQSAYDEALVRLNAFDAEAENENVIASLNAAVFAAQEAVSDAETKYNSYASRPDDDPEKARAAAVLSDAKLKLKEAEANLTLFGDEGSAAEKQTALEANLAIALMRLEEAEKALEILQSGDQKALEQSISASDGTALSKLKMDYLAYENARTALQNTELVAPFDGVVGSLNISTGQTVGSNPVITLTSMDTLLVKFYLDESDLSGLKPGNRTVYTFNAYPDLTLEGEVLAIEPSIQSIEGSPVVVAWGSLLEEPPVNLLPGMTLDVEVINAEAIGALIIPVQALREITEDSYAVFVMQADGTLKLTPVTIGLRDFANAEVLSGLEGGDIVSTGNVETK